MVSLSEIKSAMQRCTAGTILVQSSSCCFGSSQDEAALVSASCSCICIRGQHSCISVNDFAGDGPKIGAKKK